MNRLSVAAVTVLFTLCGCVGPTVTDGKGTQNTAANRSVWSPDGQVESTLHGVYPTNYEVGDGQINGQTGGPNHVLGLSLGDVRLASGNPADTTIRDLSVTLADGSSISIGELTTLESSVIAAWDDQVLAAIRADESISANQLATFESLYATSGNVLGSLIKALAPAPVP